ncbi:MAG: pilus assembly protein N-terminal domain-containing protein [Pirellulaceae bacterium]|nr:pilus assembly protein N-terminal domain-containing protein [Planctomycetales bacterium]
MYPMQRTSAHPARLAILSVFAVILAGSAATAQLNTIGNSVNFKVDTANQRLEMVVGSSRILTLDEDIPRMLVSNQDVVRVAPLSPNQIQLAALKPGVAQVNLWTKSGEIRSVDVIIFGDARQLELVLQSEFPNAAIRVRPLANSVILSGFVEQGDSVDRIVQVAEDYYPKVINHIKVGGVQQVALHVKVMEVSRTKLRSLGFDWGNINGGDFIIQGASGLVSPGSSGAGGIVGTGADTIRFGVVDGNDGFFGFVDALRRNNLVKVLAEPTLTTVSGRPARFISGGEFPILVPQALNSITIQYKEFGTALDFVPIVLGNGNIRLEVRPEVSEIDNSRGVSANGTTVPGLRKRTVDTAVEMRAGQTLALAGLIQTRVESENRGVPWLADLPWAGAAFRRVQETINEVELLVLVRPELVDALDGCDVPQYGPGEQTESPKDIDLFFRGYLEVPVCNTPQSCFSKTLVGPAAAPGGLLMGNNMPVQNGAGYAASPATTGEASSGQSYESYPVNNYSTGNYDTGGADNNVPAYGNPSTDYTAPYGAQNDQNALPPGASYGTEPYGQTYGAATVARSSSNGGQSYPQNRYNQGGSSEFKPELLGPSGYDKLDY